jgi:hypothetical protein
MLTEGGGGLFWRAAVVSKGLLAREVEDLGLFLLPNGRLGRRFTRTEEDEITMEASLGLFLLPQGRPRPRFSTTTPVSRSITPVSAMEIS